MVYAFAPPLAAIEFQTWQSWAGAVCLVIAAAAVMTGVRKGGISAERGSLYSGKHETKLLEVVCAVATVLSVIAACVFFMWSTYDPAK